MEHIDAILYINLEHRTDRNEHILAEIQKVCMDTSKIHRINAVKREPGALGCGLSHIEALTFALSHEEWNTVLILEDDFTFKPNINLQEQIGLLFSHCGEFDVGLLSYNPNHFNCDATATVNANDQVKKVLYSQTTSSYIIRRSYIPTLLQNMRESTYDMERFGKKHENCLDIYWTRLQPEGRWYTVIPAIGYQYDNYSDIEQRFTSYGC